MRAALLRQYHSELELVDRLTPEITRLGMLRGGAIVGRAVLVP